MDNSHKYTYDAFISYSHVDRVVAEKLHKVLEAYRAPRSILKKYGKKKLTKVFRDRDELPTSSNLSESIEKSLESSRYLIVICSSATKESKWVLQEIETFKRLYGSDMILTLLVEGEPSEAFPEGIKYMKAIEEGSLTEIVKEVEPLAADIRAESLKKSLKLLKVEKLRLLAPLFGCSFDELRQRHKDRLIRNTIITILGVAMISVGFGGFTLRQNSVINASNIEAKKQAEIAKVNEEEAIASANEPSYGI